MEKRLGLRFVLVFFGPFGVAVASLCGGGGGVGGAGGGGGLVLVLFVRLFDLCLFGFVGFPLPLGVWGWEGGRGGGRAAVCDCGTPCTFLLPFFFFKSVLLELNYVENS